MTGLRMSRRTRARWQAATSLRELGELTALWLEGEIDSQPGYEPGCGPEEETTDLVPTLALANRAGYLTDASQPGTGAEVGYDGATWVQRAAVEGWIETHRAQALIKSGEDAGLIVITHPVLKGWFARREPGWVDVTLRDGQTVTGFGRQRHARDVRFQYQECSRAAVRAVLTSVQVTLAAPDYGPHDRLWQVLGEWSSHASERPPSSADWWYQIPEVFLGLDGKPVPGNVYRCSMCQAKTSNGPIGVCGVCGHKEWWLQ